MEIHQSPRMRLVLLILLSVLAPLAHAQRSGTATVTASHATGLSALIDGDGFTLRTTAIGFTTVDDRGRLAGLRIGTETRGNADEEGRALFVMVEGGQVSNPSGMAGMMLVGMAGYNSLNRHARPLGYAFPTLGVEVGPWVRVGPIRAEVLGGLTSFALFSGGGVHARVAAGLQL